MVIKHTTFFHHFLQMAVAQWIRRVPPDANQNDVDWEAHSFGSQHRVSSLFSQSAQHRPAGGLTANATEPSVLPAEDEDPEVIKLRAKLDLRIGEVQLPEVILAVDAQVRFSWIMLGREHSP